MTRYGFRRGHGCLLTPAALRPLTYCSLVLIHFLLCGTMAFRFPLPLTTAPRVTPSSIPPNRGDSIPLNNDAAAFHPDDLVRDYTQNFHGIFPPLQRPLSLRAESQPARGLYLFEQPLDIVPEVHIFARMAVYALADGSVLVYNPIAPTEETLREIEDAFGYPDHIIVPTTSYSSRAFVKAWVERFPRAIIWGLKGVKLPGAKFTRDLTIQSFPKEWKAELDVSILEGSFLFRECFMLHRSTKSVFAMDSLLEIGEGNIEHPALRTSSIVARNLGRPVCPTKALLWDRERCKAAISKVLEWDFGTVYAAHGVCPIYDAKNAIWEEFQFLWD